MALTIGEASAVATILRVVVGDTSVGVESLQEAFHTLNERAAKALQLSRIVMDGHGLDAAAHRLTQHNEDAR